PAPAPAATTAPATTTAPAAPKLGDVFENAPSKPVVCGGNSSSGAQCLPDWGKSSGGGGSGAGINPSRPESIFAGRNADKSPDVRTRWGDEPWRVFAFAGALAAIPGGVWRSVGQAEVGCGSR